MKRIYTIIFAMAFVMASLAQENKPEPGKTGIGFNILGGGFGNRISLSRRLKNGWEPGFQIGFIQNNASTSSIDSVTVFTDNGPKRGITTSTSSTPNMSLAFVPVIAKHAEIASNLDAFVGLQIPLIFGPGSTLKTNDKTQLTDYYREVDVVKKQPSTNSFGLNIGFGAQWFFVKNLGVGAICGLGAAYTIQKGNIETTTITTNSGSLNPSSTTVTTTTLSVQNNKTTTIMSFNNVLGLFLTYYF
jgi:hypothetical protein